MSTAISYPNGKILRAQTSPAGPTSSWLRSGKVPDRWAALLTHLSQVRGTQWESNRPYKAGGTWPVFLEAAGGEGIYSARLGGFVLVVC